MFRIETFQKLASIRSPTSHSVERAHKMDSSINIDQHFFGA